MAGYRFGLLGVVGTEVRIALEHVTRSHPDVAPHWPSVGPSGFRVIVEGTPSFTTEVVFKEDDQTTAGCEATAARLVNSIATVCAAPSGVCSCSRLVAMARTRAHRAHDQDGSRVHC